MSDSTNTPPTTSLAGDVEHHLSYLKLSFMAQHYAELATQAAQKMWPHVDYLARLLEGEANLRQDRATKSRIRLARFPVITTLEQFRWDWPTRINRLQVQHHFHLEFIKAKANLLFLGGVGLGKTHLATALGYAACLQGYSVLLASAIDVIIPWSPPIMPAGSKRNSKNTPNPPCSFSMSWGICRLTRWARICSSKSSRCAMSRGRS